jgi:hypothetical protein
VSEHARERALRFGGGPGPVAGSSGSLVGILAEPTGGSGSLPGVVLVNSGILHRVGACRLHVKLARRLAERGFTSLRFDHSGIGDSEARRDSLPFEKSAILEIRDALDWLASKRGVERFVVVGLCSGADMAFEAAREDSRIAGVVLLDPWAYRTPRYWFVHYRSRVLSLTAWRRFLARKLRPRAATAAGSSVASEDLDLPTYVRRFPARERVAADLRALVERDARLLCIFSGGQPDDYNHEGQLRSAFRKVPLGEHLQELFLPEADHIFTDLEQQETVLRRVEHWLEALSGAERRSAEQPGGAERRSAEPLPAPAPGTPGASA